MIEALMLAGGVVAIAVGVAALLAFALALVLGIAMWETWWLHPVWALVVVPLGIPAITFWQLFALNIFVSALWMSTPPGDYAKEADKTKENIGRVARLFVVLIRPVVAYYAIRWALVVA